MGKYLDLINASESVLENRADLKAPGGGLIKTNVDRYNLIQDIINKAQLITVYANKKFTVMFGKDNIVEVAAGENKFAPSFAFWLFGIYGVNQHYGTLAKMKGVVVSDEPLTNEEIEKCVAAPKKKTREAKAAKEE